jgi:glutaredoxin
VNCWPPRSRCEAHTKHSKMKAPAIIASFGVSVVVAFQPPPSRPRVAIDATTCLRDMKRPILDGIATFLFKLETDRVASSSVMDERGRSGEPMEWAEEDSIANRFSELISSNDIGYKFKQVVADFVAGDYDKEARLGAIRNLISDNPVAMYSFTTCPFCRKAKDYLEERSIPYKAIELDLLPGNEGNEIRAELGRMTRRTSVPSIFIGGE